jgi:hypothetical protein
MVSKDAALSVIGLMIVMLLFSGRSLVQAANRQQAGSVKQTAQRVMAFCPGRKVVWNALLVSHGEHCARP